MQNILQHYKALSDESRLRLLRVLLRGRYNVNELMQVVDMGQSRVSRHLKVLVEAGLAEVQRQGTWAYYQASAGGDEGVRAQLDLLAQHGEQIAQSAADEARRQDVIEQRRRQSREFHDRVAADWHRLRAELPVGSEPLEKLLAEVEGADTVADLGCGDGALLLSLAQRSRRVIGVDSSPAMLAEAGARLASADPDQRGRVDLRLGGLEHLPLADAESDRVVLSMVLHHLAEPSTVLREVRRALKDDGALIICDLARHGHEWMRDRFGDQWLGFEPGELYRLASEAGLEISSLDRYTQTADAAGLDAEVLVAVAQTGRQIRTTNPAKERCDDDPQ